MTDKEIREAGKKRWLSIRKADNSYKPGYWTIRCRSGAAYYNKNGSPYFTREEVISGLEN